MFGSLLNSGFELLAIDMVELNSNWSYKDITSTFYRLYYVEEGQGLIYNADQALKLESGNLYLVPSFTNCNYQCDDYMLQYYVCFNELSANGSSLFVANRKLFRIDATLEDQIIIKRILDLNPRRELKGSYNPKMYEKSSILEDFGERNKIIPLSAYIETCGLLLQVISRFISAEYFTHSVGVSANNRVSDAIYYIQTNLQDQITVESLAKRAGKAPAYFSRLFKVQTGVLPLIYIQKTRIARAQLLLQTTNLTISEIALQTGYDSISYFARVFKKMTGQTPGRYKRGRHK